MFVVINDRLSPSQLLPMNTQTAPLPTSAPPLAQSPQPHRLASLDVFRGLIIAGMILVTNPGAYTAVYPPLLHAQWYGATPADIIFPAFLVIIGVSLTLSFRARLRRGATHARLLLHRLPPQRAPLSPRPPGQRLPLLSPPKPPHPRRPPTHRPLLPRRLRPLSRPQPVR